MMITWIMLRIFLFGLLTFYNTCFCKFYAGTLSWKQEDNSTKVRLVYRMAWEKGTGPCGPGCSSRDVGKKATISGTLPFNTSVFNSLLGGMHYVITDVSATNISGWEQGESTYVFTPSIRSSVVNVTNLPWIGSGNGNNKDIGYLQTMIDTRIRNDTNRSNISPIASIPPYIGAAYGCISTMKIPTDDPDGDRTVCRWAQPSECRGGCTNVPTGSVSLNRSSCSITIKATSGGQLKAGKFYRMTIVIEDFPDYPVTVGTELYTENQRFSQIPYQVSLWISNISTQCDQQNMTFVMATPKNFVSLFLTVDDIKIKHKWVNTSFYLRTDHQNSLNFIVSGPRGIHSSILTDDLSRYLHRTDVVKLNIVWRPDYNTQTGTSQICVWGIDIFTRLTTEARCFTVYSGDYNMCTSTTCQNNGTCRNVYGLTEKCHCKTGFKGQYCQLKTPCYTNPCRNNGTCHDVFTRGYYCSCTAGFAGMNCDINTTIGQASGPQNKGDNVVQWAVTGGVLGLFLLLLAVLILYRVMKSAKESETNARRIKVNPMPAPTD